MKNEKSKKKKEKRKEKEEKEKYMKRTLRFTSSLNIRI